jgi:hypothetical protein
MFAFDIQDKIVAFAECVAISLTLVSDHGCKISLSQILASEEDKGCFAHPPPDIGAGITG